MTEPITVTDVRGRKITFVPMDVLEQARMALVVGRGGHPEDTQNTVFMQLAAVAYCVTEIDGVPMSRPATHAQIMAAIGTLGDDGFNAVVVHLREDMERAESAAMAAMQKATAKNSPATPIS